MSAESPEDQSEEVFFSEGFFSNRTLLFFFCAALIFGFIVPAFFLHSPSGTDVYTHLYNTLRMVNSNSLSGFYDTLYKEDIVGANYPFGLWFFGSIFMKVTGLDLNTLAYVLPLIFFIITVIIFFVYAKDILQSETAALLSIIFLITMPIIAISIMNYSTSIFVAIFLIMILHLATGKLSFNKLVIIALLVFILAFTHTGTFIFLLFVTICYFTISAVIWRRFDLGSYFLFVIQLFTFIFTVQIFPFIQPQYIDKGRMVLTSTEKLTEITGLSFLTDMGQILYQNLFVSNNITYAIFWSCILFVFGKSILYIQKTFIQVRDRWGVEKFPVSIPIIGDVQKGVISLPFWIGPIQTLLSGVGLFFLDRRGKCIALSLGLVALFPGSMQPEVGTGALREMYYLFLIVPLSAAAGFGYLMPFFVQKVENLKTRSAIIFLVVTLIFVSLIAVPIIGTLYYQPTITGTANEKQNLIWLSSVGDSYEGVSDYAYRERVNLYANKTTPFIASGYETRQYYKGLKGVYFSSNAEGFVNDLYSMDIHYLIVSDRIHKGFESNQSSLRIDSNRQVNKIFSSDDDFGIYQLIPQQVTTQVADIKEDFRTLKFIENNPKIQNAGSVYLVENDYYKMKISMKSPEIVYIGLPDQNMLGEGAFSDIVALNWGTIDHPKLASYIISDIPFSNISYKDNVIEYKATITDENKKEKWATLIVRYVFFEKAAKREIIIANDHISGIDNSRLYLSVMSSIFAPAQNFQYKSIEDGQEKDKTKIFYPAQDAVNFKDKKITEIYLDEGDTGLMIKYTDSAPYPSRLSYQGSTIYEYGGASLSSDFSLNTAEPVDITQYFAVGDRETAIRNIDEYLSVEISPYPRGIVPAIVIGTPRISPTAVTLVDNSSGEESLANFTRIKNISVPPAAPDMSALYSRLKLNNVSYNEAVAAGQQVKDQTMINPIGYAKRSVNQTMNQSNDLDTQITQLQELKRVARINGVLFQYFIYNMNSIEAIHENKMIFGIPYTVSAPLFYDFFREGVRDPKIAYVQGEKTDVVLLPVTQPLSSMLYSGDDPNTIFTRWRDTIDSVIDVGGVAVFIWDTDDITSFQTEFLDLISYSRSKNVTFTTPDEIAKHYLDLQKISTNVKKNLDSVDLVIKNSNSDPVEGITYRITLPTVKETCRYTVTNAIVRDKKINKGTCVMSVSVDLSPGEVKEVQLFPEDVRSRFNLDISEIYEGTNKLMIRDADLGSPVGNATLTIDNRKMYESNNEGLIEFPIKRGLHIIRIEKPGFITVENQTEVKGIFSKVIGTII